MYRRGTDFDRVVELLNRVQKAEAAAERARKQVLEAVKDIYHAGMRIYRMKFHSNSMQ